MRNLTSTLLFLLALLINIQIGLAQDKELVAQKMSSLPGSFDTVELLAAQIDSSFDNDLDKVYAVYWWITHHIEYSYRALPKYDLISRKAIREDRDNYKTIKSKEIANFTISNNYAVCEGYSVLFESLCDELGIECRKVTGFGKVSPEDIGKRIDDTNHAWNIVTIDGESFLVDSTWGAGHTNGKWIPSPSDFYFKTPPSQFFLKHYPKNKEDALISPAPSIDSFIDAPVYYDWQGKMIEMTSPDSGIIRKPKMSFRDIRFELLVGDTMPTQILVRGAEVSLIKDYKLEDGKLSFNYKVSSQFPNDTLTIFFDGESVITFAVK